MELIQIFGSNIELTDDIKEHIKRELKNLEKFHDGRVAPSIKVEVGRTTGHHQKGKIFRAEINMPAFGRMLRAEEAAENIHTALNIVKEEIERQIKKFKEKRAFP